MDEALARHYARRLPFTATHLVISQTLLPFLWRDGVLGGRSFDVLMTRLPLEALQTTLDRAAQAWPMSPTLADFRAEPALLAAERDALAAARYWITPHSKIARLAGAKAREARLAPAHLWSSRNANDGAVFFPASTLGRKGAYELREVARDLDLTLALGGGILEDNEFWNGVTAGFRRQRSALDRKTRRAPGLDRGPAAPPASRRRRRHPSDCQRRLRS